jgi:hypothetical protein
MNTKKYARIENKIVREIIHLDTDTMDITQMFHPYLVWVLCEEEEVIAGWTFSDGVFEKPAPGPAPDIRQEAIQTLVRLDKDLPRVVEDILAVLDIDEESLPQIVQDRLQAKRNARKVIHQGGN